jgi:hypothetical protein
MRNICKENAVHELNEFEECFVLLCHLGICSHNFLSELACIIQGVPGGMCQTSGGCSLC